MPDPLEKIRHAIRESPFPWTIWWFIAKEFLLSFLICFLFFFFMFFMNQILYMAEQILSNRAPLLQVILLLVYAMPTFASLSFPFATLVAVLMSVGKLSSDNEILVMQASGISMKRIFVPFMVLGVAVSGLSFVMNDVFLPLGAINFSKTYRKMIYSTPSLELKSWNIKRYERSTIVTGEVKGSTIMGALIFDTAEDKKRRTITAEKAMLKEGNADTGVISLVLENITITMQDPGNPSRYEYSTATKMAYNILISQISNSVSSLQPREMSSIDVKKYIDREEAKNAELDAKKRKTVATKVSALSHHYFRVIPAAGSAGGATTEMAWNELDADFQAAKTAVAELKKRSGLANYVREYNKKFSLPFASIFFIIFSFPVGLLARKSGKTVGFLIGIIVSMVYWLVMYGSDAMGARVAQHPVLVTWLPNFIVAAIGLLFILGRKLKWS